MTLTTDTKNGTLIFDTIQVEGGFKGRVQHNLHKRPEFNGKVLTRFSKVYKTRSGAKKWAQKQFEINNA